MVSVTVTTANFALAIPSYGVYALIALFTFLLHLELLKLMRNVLSEGTFITASSYKKTIFAISIILFAIIPLAASAILNQPNIYSNTIITLFFITLCRAYLFEREI